MSDVHECQIKFEPIFVTMYYVFFISVEVLCPFTHDSNLWVYYTPNSSTTSGELRHKLYLSGA